MAKELHKLVARERGRQESHELELAETLRKLGWSQSSDYPGSMWLWSKSFPESKTQWRWVTVDGKRVQIPHPPFTINGAPLDTAVAIELAWQDNWDDNRS